MAENKPLLDVAAEVRTPSYVTNSVDAAEDNRQNDGGESGGVRLRRHVTLFGAIAIIISNVIGSGIFISPQEVVRSLYSPGATLIIWAVMGLYTLGQALCYAELGAAIPRYGKFNYNPDIFPRILLVSQSIRKNLSHNNWSTCKFHYC